MPYLTGADLISQTLFRASEITGSSGWDEQVLDYINRNYLLLCAGASEYLPDTVEDWWWLRARDVLTITPPYSTGTVTVSNNSAGITFSDPPLTSLVGYRFRVDDNPEVYVITTHIAGNASATLDSVYNGPTNLAANYDALKNTYTLSASVSAIMSSLVSFRENPQISGMQPERMDTLYPLSRLRAGVPQAFSLENDTTIRFSHAGLENQSMRFEYRYRPVVTLLTNSGSSVPLLPVQYRPLLVEMALVQVYADKNDDRINICAAAAKAGLMAMVKENKRRLTKMDLLAGQIIPRQGANDIMKLLRTESGLIIG